MKIKYLIVTGLLMFNLIGQSVLAEDFTTEDSSSKDKIVSTLKNGRYSPDVYIVREVPYKIIYEPVGDMKLGEEIVHQKGVPGEVQIIKWYEYEDGKEVKYWEEEIPKIDTIDEVIYVSPDDPRVNVFPIPEPVQFPSILVPSEDDKKSSDNHVDDSNNKSSVSKITSNSSNELKELPKAGDSSILSNSLGLFLVIGTLLYIKKRNKNRC